MAIAGTFLFALKSIFIKLAFDAGADPVLLLTIRMIVSLPIFVFVLGSSAVFGDYEPLRWFDVARSFFLGFLGYYLASFLDLSGLQFISAQLERMTLFTYPAMVAVLAWLFLGEEINRRIVIAIVCCYAGVLLMYGHESALPQGANARQGVLLVALSALSYSVYILFAKPTLLVIGSRQFTSLAMIGSTFFVSVHFGCTRPLTDLITAPKMVYVIGTVLALVCTVIPSFMINEAILRIGATRTTVIGSVGPVLTMLLAITILGESSSVWHFIGMAVAIGGVSLVTKR